MDAEAFKDRTKVFALDVARVVQALPNDLALGVIKRQLVRSATSVGANYRAACGGRSSAEFRSKLGIVEEEADESGYWLELLLELSDQAQEELSRLHQESWELTAMVAASIRTSKNNKVKEVGPDYTFENPEAEDVHA